MNDESTQRKMAKAALLARLRGNCRQAGTDVHTSHCCASHGCKYGSPDCTVVTGVLPQEYLCEDCDYDVQRIVSAEEPADSYARSVVKMGEPREDLRARNYIVVGEERIYLSRRKTLQGKKAQYADAYWAVKSAYIAGRTSEA